MNFPLADFRQLCHIFLAEQHGPAADCSPAPTPTDRHLFFFLIFFLEPVTGMCVYETRVHLRNDNWILILFVFCLKGAIVGVRLRAWICVRRLSDDSCWRSCSASIVTPLWRVSLIREMSNLPVQLGWVRWRTNGYWSTFVWLARNVCKFCPASVLLQSPCRIVSFGHKVCRYPEWSLMLSFVSNGDCILLTVRLLLINPACCVHWRVSALSC